MVKFKSRPCSECREAETQYRKISLEFEKNGIKVRVLGIPAEVCPKCGAQYLPPGISQEIKEAVDEMVKAAEKSRKEAPSLREYKVTVA